MLINVSHVRISLYAADDVWYGKLYLLSDPLYVSLRVPGIIGFLVSEHFISEYVISE